MKKRIVLAVLGICLAMSSMFALSACGKSDEDLIRDALKSDFDRMKAADIEGMPELASGISGLEAYGIDANEFLKAWLGGMDYTLGAVKIDDKKATVEASITAKQLGPAMNSLMEGDIDASEFSGLSLSEQEEKFSELIYAALDKQTPSTHSVTLSFTLVGNTWEADAINTEIYIDVFIGELGQ
ncbi:MAG: hypothetical protein LBG81_01430 [Coriobacteriaceae bacterium]|jgi:hypothetical protein|nr:hypothetical protein [Coriobacteriaceae bacterium]